MNRKQKIVVSIVGITIVMLALLGMTYAYYLTRIQGNTNSNSISVTTADLKLEYGDGTKEILAPITALLPSNEPIGTKDFTVTNSGNDNSYVVVIENVSVTKVSDGSETTFESNDFRYTLTCVKSDNTHCDEVNEQTLLPLKDSVLISNKITAGDTHSYVLTVWYIDTGIDQSNDMGKSMNARINIKDISGFNPYSTGVSSTDNKSLTYNIIENARKGTNGTKLVNVTDTNVASEISWTRETGKYKEEYISIGSLDCEYDSWLVGDTPGKAKFDGDGINSYEDAVGKYVYDQR